jgi:hypothetical protein
MYDLILFLIISGGAAAGLALAFLIFNALVYTAYKLSGGRWDLISYLMEERKQ